MTVHDYLLTKPITIHETFIDDKQNRAVKEGSLL